MRNRWSLAVLIMLLCLGLASCGKKEDEQKHSSLLQTATPHSEEKHEEPAVSPEPDNTADDRSDIEKLINGKYDFSSTAVDMTVGNDAAGSAGSAVGSENAETGAENQGSATVGTDAEATGSGTESAGSGAEAAENGTESAGTEAAGTESTGSGMDASENDGDSFESSQEPEVDGTVVIDNDEISFIINNIEARPGKNEIEIGYFLSNRTDSWIMVQIDEIAVNNYEFYQNIKIDRAAASFDFGSFLLENVDFTGMGTDAAEKLEMQVKLMPALTETDTSETADESELTDCKELCIYPTGLSEEELSARELVFRNGENVCMGNDDCSFIVLEKGTDEKGFYMDLFMENFSDDSLTFSWSNTALNGILFDMDWSRTVRPGYRAIERIYTDLSNFEYFGVKKAEKFQFALDIQRPASEDEDSMVFIDLFVLNV
ncbi:MAG: hypothetical protein MJ131_04745 [Lachnospiraceae bacterium]|nr:hypothetical protein [Lachnospiraceae bacterium]